MSEPTQRGSTTALREFFATEAAGGVLLLSATAVALIWANSPGSASYETLWETRLSVGLGRYQLTNDLRHWINEGLMAIFFLVVGLEVKREFLLGELRERRKAMLPIVAALGGMIVPALLYLALNRRGTAAEGWGIPMATDIAFAVGVLAIVGRSSPPGVRLFLLTLAIVDDIGAIVVIAFFYANGLELGWLVASVGLVCSVALLRRFGVDSIPVYAVVGIALWLALRASGVHPTLAGVAIGLMVSPSQLEWLERKLHGWSSFLIVPLFALANAGVMLSVDGLRAAATSRVTIGIVVGLVIGKTCGIAAASWLATRLGLAELPEGVGWRHLFGAAALGGVGFTVSLFIAGLAFDSPAIAVEAKLGVLFASLVAAGLGAALLRSGSADP